MRSGSELWITSLILEVRLDGAGAALAAMYKGLKEKGAMGRKELCVVRAVPRAARSAGTLHLAMFHVSLRQ